MRFRKQSMLWSKEWLPRVGRGGHDHFKDSYTTNIGLIGGTMTMTLLSKYVCSQYIFSGSYWNSAPFRSGDSLGVPISLPVDALVRAPCHFQRVRWHKLLGHQLVAVPRLHTCDEQCNVRCMTCLREGELHIMSNPYPTIGVCF